MKFTERYGNDKKNPWSLDNIARIKSEFDKDPESTKKAYPELFYYFDGLLGTKVSQSIHPAGIVISPITLNDNYGTFEKDGDNCLFIDMDEAHEVGLAKYDFLILKTVQVIRDTCNYIGIPYPKTHEINWDDQEVWADMRKNLTAIFQFESSFAADSFKKFKTNSIYDMSLVTACIRPSGSSYRNDLMVRKRHHNPSPLIDELLNDNLGYLVYQEDVIKFLQQICGLSGSEADTVRRGIAKKRMEILDGMLPKIIDGYCKKSDKPKEIAEAEVKEYLKVIEDASSYMFGLNHSIAYCLLGYLCGYFRYHYPYEFLTAYLNNAANDEDIANGTQYAAKAGIKITVPKWGVSKNDYFFDKDAGVISKGISSIKFMGSNTADQLYQMSHNKKYRYFVDVLKDLNDSSVINSRQIDILTKIDFFSEFGNQRELLFITDMFQNTFKSGTAKSIKKDSINNPILDSIVCKYSNGLTKSGAQAKSYTIIDMGSILREAEEAIKSVHMSDLSDILKVQNFADAMGYPGYVSGKDEDRRKLYVMDIYALKRKLDNKQFGYSIITKSIGSGKEARFTVTNSVFNKEPISKTDIILCKKYERNGQYFRLTDYERLF